MLLIHNEIIFALRLIKKPVHDPVTGSVTLLIDVINVMKLSNIRNCYAARSIKRGRLNMFSSKS